MSKHSTSLRLASLSAASSLAAALTAIAACSMALTAGKDLQLLPAGTFTARDGRPTDAPNWHIDAKLAQVLINAASARATPYVLDYDHQTLMAASNGQPAPAAGFFHKLEWREGVGLFATDVDWTPRAKSMIEAGEYRFVSPVITYDKTGAVTGLLMAAITNNPAIDGMADVLQAAASAHFAATAPTTTQENQMDKELRALLCMLLGLAATATDAEMQTKATALHNTAKQGLDATAAASLDIAGLIGTQRTAIASLSSATPDPSKYVPVALMQDLQARFATLSTEHTAGRVDQVVKAALAAGKLVPAQEAWARDFGAKDLTALSSYLNVAPPIAALAGTQTGGKGGAEGGEVAALSADQMQMCKAFGISVEDYCKTMKADADAKATA